VLVHCDSTMAIEKIKNHYYNGNKIQIRRKNNTIRECLSNGAVRVYFIPTNENLADHLTKGLNKEKVQDTSSRMVSYPHFGPKNTHSNFFSISDTSQFTVFYSAIFTVLQLHILLFLSLIFLHIRPSKVPFLHYKSLESF